MRNLNEMVEEIAASRAKLPSGTFENGKPAEEGGCGVTGFIANIPMSGKHIFEPSVQMHNRGNGKGGGIAAVGLDPGSLGVTQQVLDTHYLLQVALLDPQVASAVEQEFVSPCFEVHKSGLIPTADDYRDIRGLDIRPPDVMRYFVRVKQNVLDKFINDNNLQDLDSRRAEDEFIYQNSYRLNEKFYASLGEKQAFVLSHARNLMILKIVGYAELVAKYYLLDNFKAHGWIAHQRYPTKGRVWHPGGAHPFIGMDEALVHNGDFANYYSISEYLRQYNINPQFLTDTEVSIQLFDLWNRNFGYPLEYIIEAMAPTTEHDFDRLPAVQQKIYRAIQQNHVHTSPDGPWFFIIARNDVYNHQFQLIGITDTAMLRPQVFAMEDNEVQIGLICSEKQAIDATLKSMAAEDKRFSPIADKYWNARGGSSTDGGAFIFTVKKTVDGSMGLSCANKFGQPVVIDDTGRPPFLAASNKPQKIDTGVAGLSAAALKDYARLNLQNWSYKTLKAFCAEMVKLAALSDDEKARVIEVLTYLNDKRLPTGDKKRAWTLNIIREHLTKIFKSTPRLKDNADGLFGHIDWSTRKSLRAPKGNEKILVIDTGKFPPEGDDCDARLIVAAYNLGWKRFIVYGCKGQRFTGCGFSQESDGVRIDVYDSSGDYLASGIDGMEIYVHGNAQDQIGQIMKRGKTVFFGDVGQTFMYGAKGGEAYIMGNAAGRPLINAVGRPRIVLNGTCLDYLAESFMAGDPHNGGGFVIVNGISFDRDGRVMSLDTPYPGSNLFSLASGGAIFLRDPRKQVSSEQLNGGEFATLREKDWELILPYLKENERLFGITLDDLLTVDGVKKGYAEVYRKVQVVKLAVLAGLNGSDSSREMPKPLSSPSVLEYAGVIPEGEDADE
jgi:glutamate synthase domain-containing protein 1/glutamate synthase domain-containing protein 3